MFLNCQICDKVSQPCFVALVGNICMTLSLVLMAPLPFLPLGSSLEMTQVAGVLEGLGNGMVVVACFGRVYKVAMELGYEDDIQTYMIISGRLIFEDTSKASRFFLLLGLWSTSFYFGNFLGPIVGGFLVEHLNFPVTTIFFFGCFVFMVMVNVGEMLLYKARVLNIARSSGENT